MILLQWMNSSIHLFIFELKSDPFLHGSPVLLIVTRAKSDSCALYLMDCSTWPIFRELLGCSTDDSMPPRASGHHLYSSQQPQGILPFLIPRSSV